MSIVIGTLGMLLRNDNLRKNEVSFDQTLLFKYYRFEGKSMHEACPIIIFASKNNQIASVERQVSSLVCLFHLLRTRNGRKLLTKRDRQQGG